MSVIELKNVCYSYSSERSKLVHVSLDNVSSAEHDASRPALRNVTLSVRKEARVVVLGENGSGKSTLLGLIGGMHCPSSGTATVLGRQAFHDTTLSGDVARIGSSWGAAVKWPSTVAGHVALERGLDQSRYEALCVVLSINPSWRIDRISDGQRRRVQLLLGLLKAKSVVLLDECSNDIDAIDRANILAYFRALGGVTVMYATHILDHMREWATDVVVIQDGAIVYDAPVTAVTTSLHDFALQWIPPRPPVAPFAMEGLVLAGTTNAVAGHALEYSYQGAPVFRDTSFEVPSGSRVLVVGRNGSGKSTLLRLLGGKHILPSGALTACGRPCFHDSTLEGDLCLAGTWWSEGDPEWDLSVAEMLGPSPTPYQTHLLDVLGVDPTWHVRKVSAGQRKRCQLLLTLQTPRRVLLLDEATADLDVVQRHRLLDFLAAYSTSTGATVLYCTHIFEDMMSWPQYILSVSTKGMKVEMAPCAADVGHVLELLRKD